MLVATCVLSLSSAWATDIVETLAGGGSLEGYAPLKANLALGSSQGIAVSAIGEIYISDSTHNQVLKISPTTAQIMIYAGDGTAAYFGDGTPAVSAGLNNPGALAFDAKGNLLIVDRGNFVVRSVDAISYLITTIAGNGMFTGQGPAPGAPIGDGGNATAATFSLSMGAIVVDSSGNVIVADSGNNCVRKFTPGSTITTIAGTAGAGGAFAGDGAAATAARLSNPTGLALDSGGVLFIADSGNRRVRQVDTAGTINSVVGNGAGGSLGFSGDGLSPTAANIGSLGGLAFDSSKRLLITCQGANRIRRVDFTAQVITTIAGNGAATLGDLGPATAASLTGPRDIALDSTGNIYIYDAGVGRIRRVDIATGFITTVIGTGDIGQNGDRGPRQFCVLVGPEGATFDGSGNLFIADTEDNSVRKVATDGTVSTFAGTGSIFGLGDGNPANLGNLSSPSDVLFANNTLFIADTGHSRIRAVNFTSNGNLITTYVQVPNPIAMVADSTGQLYVTTNNQVVRIGTDFSVNAFVGNSPNFAAPNFGDGLVAGNAVLSNPTGLCLASNGDLYIADSGHDLIRLVHNNVISTYAGGGANVAPAVGDGGAGNAANLNNPQGVSIDPTGANLIIADTDNHRIRSMSLAGPTSVISTICGNGTAGFNGDGDVAASALVNFPTRIFVNGGGLVFADTGNNRVRKIVTVIDIPSTQLSFGAKLTFALDKKTGDLQEDKDSVQLKASLPLPAGITAANLPIAVDIVDLHQSTQLDAKGKQPKQVKAKKTKASKTGTADTLAAKTPKAPKGGTISPGFLFTPSTGETIADSKFQLSLKGTSAAGGKPTSFSFSSKGSFDEELGRAGFTNVTTSKTGVDVTLRINITLGTTVFSGTTKVNYKAQQGKNGSAKSSKK
jgi:sugar lactone lactonase YvrE